MSRVLVVEDSFDNAENIERMLKRFGVEEVVVILEKPMTAIENATTLLQTEKFDLVTVDGLQDLGWDFVLQLRERGINAIVLSSSTLSRDWEREHPNAWIDKYEATDKLHKLVAKL